jgi:hypothetical protein
MPVMEFGKLTKMTFRNVNGFKLPGKRTDVMMKAVLRKVRKYFQDDFNRHSRFRKGY